MLKIEVIKFEAQDVITTSLGTLENPVTDVTGGSGGAATNGTGTGNSNNGQYSTEAGGGGGVVVPGRPGGGHR